MSKEKAKSIILSIPVKLLAKEAGISERVSGKWKVWAETGDYNDKGRCPNEQHLRKVLKLKDLAKRIEKGSYEAGYGEEIVKPIRLNRKDFDLKLTDHYGDIIYHGDVHEGHPQCNIKLAIDTAQYSLDHNVPMVLMGDMGEFSGKGSPGDTVFTQKTVQYQIDSIEDRFRLHAERGLLLGYHKGNHEDRINKQTGVDVCRLICKILDIPYLHGACWHLHKVGGEYYSVYSLHGSSGARYKWTKLAYYVGVAQPFKCDLLVGAHVHDVGNTIVTEQGINKSKTGVAEYIKHVVMTGGFLNYDLSYAQDKGYSIPTLGSAKVRFYADEHKITVHDVFQGKESKPIEWDGKR